MEFVMACVVKPGRPVDPVHDELRDRVSRLLTRGGETLRDLRLGRSIVLVVDRPDKPYRDQWVEHVNGRLIGFRGYSTMPDFSMERLGELTVSEHRRGQRRRSGAFQLEASPGGLYGAIVVEDADPLLRAWASHGNVEAMFYAEHPDAWVVGTNPLAVHVAAQRDGKVRLDTEWSRRVIVPGATLGDETPFLGTRYIPSRCCLRIDGDRIVLESHPVAVSVKPQRASHDELYAEALRTVSPCATLPDPLVSLSGGKDSRAALAAIVGAGVGVRGFTTGPEASGEVQVARQVARAVGLDHDVFERRAVERSEFWDTVRANVRQADGLLSENRHLVHPVPSSYTVEVHGQAHHLRGGFMTRGKYRSDELTRALAGPFSSGRNYCVPELGVEVDRAIAEYRQRDDVGSRGLELYWIYGDLRIARWLHGGFAKLRKTKLLIWPFLDERLLEVAARLPRRDRIHEGAQYELIARGSPDIAALPLFDSVWRFDQRGMTGSVHPQWGPSRTSTTEYAPVGPTTRSPGHSIGTLLPFVREGLASTSTGAVIRGWLSPEMNEMLDGGSVDPVVEINGRFRLYSFLWRLVGLSAVYEGGWLPPPLELAD